MKRKVLLLLKIPFLMLFLGLTAYGQPSKNNESKETPAERLYKEAYYSTLNDFNTCIETVDKQKIHISTLDNQILTMQQRIEKFEAVLYRKNKKRRALGLFFYWKRHRKNF